MRQQLKKMVFGKLTKCSLGPFHQQRWNGYSTSAGDTSKGGITIPPLLVITSRGGITIPPLLVIFSPKNAIRYGIFRPLVVILSFRSLHRNGVFSQSKAFLAIHSFCSLGFWVPKVLINQDKQIITQLRQRL